MGKLTFGATGGLSYQVEEVKLKVGGAPTCPRCTQRVYFNEEKRALGKVWHKRCFTCGKCKKNLDSTNCAEHDGDIFCTMCHKRQFGPTGYGFAGGASGLRSEVPKEGAIPKPSASSSVLQAQASIRRLPATINKDDPQCCPRCGKRVYFAEEVKAVNRKWHRLCFKCTACARMLEQGRVSGHEGQLYCQACYGRNYGPKGYGFAGGAGTLLSSEPQPFRRSSLNTPVNQAGRRSPAQTSSGINSPAQSSSGRSSPATPPENGIVNGPSHTIFSSYKNDCDTNGGDFSANPDYEVDYQKEVSPIRGTQQWTEAVYL